MATMESRPKTDPAGDLADSKPTRDYEWRDGVRVDFVGDDFSEADLVAVLEADPDTTGLGRLMDFVRRHSKLES